LLILLDEDAPFDFADGPSLVLNGVLDPGEIFVKNEPHPRRKRGKWRCITNKSLADKIVESVFYSEHAESLRTPEKLFRSGSAIGIGFTDEMARDFTNFCMGKTALFGPVVGLDVSGFDGLHTLESLLATVSIDAKSVQVSGSSSDHWMLGNERLVTMSANSTSYIDGELFLKLAIGMIDSGSKDTSRRNTMLALFYMFYLSILSKQKANFAEANGDDGLVWGIKDLERFQAAAEVAGIALREVKQSGTSVAFCSHEFDFGDKLPVLTSWPKSVYRILCMPNMLEADARAAVKASRHNEIHKRLVMFLDAITWE